VFITYYSKTTLPYSVVIIFSQPKQLQKSPCFTYLYHFLRTKVCVDIHPQPSPLKSCTYGVALVDQQLLGISEHIKPRQLIPTKLVFDMQSRIFKSTKINISTEYKYISTMYSNCHHHLIEN